MIKLLHCERRVSGILTETVFNPSETFQMANKITKPNSKRLVEVFIKEEAKRLHEEYSKIAAYFR